MTVADDTRPRQDAMTVRPYLLTDRQCANYLRVWDTFMTLLPVEAFDDEEMVDLGLMADTFREGLA